MNKSGIGIGSASAALVFVTLCLTVFALISYIAAENAKALADAEAGMVKGYYGADAAAGEILAEILAADAIPDSVRGVKVAARREKGLTTVEFSCAASGGKELYVKAAIRENSYDILSWRTRNAEAWTKDDHLPVWAGD